MDTGRQVLCRLALAVVLSFGVVVGATDERPPGADDDAPRDLGLVERAGRGLVQLDLSVRGSWEAISNLGAQDFRVSVNGNPIEQLTVDRLCGPPAAAETATGGGTEGTPAAHPSPGASYLFYFDQPMLTAAGRQNSIDIARRMLPELIGDDDRAAIVSAGKRLETLVELTGDTEALLA
ncbi:MAG TPA: hypothetical protein VD788_02970, partial [Candidatus Polarisedimenticolaceae bacterium]|nr:hypothetical protein [Candidatus Polarisedimenticolaceae bacterium]